MKAERLLAILTILLNRKKISAAALSRELEVSVRTIYRDIEALSESGIPVFATYGRDGGFELVEGFTMDSQVLETGEVRQILAGLQSLSAVHSGPEIGNIIEKFSLILKKSESKGIKSPENHIFIELTPSKREKEIIGRIEDSIRSKGVLRVRYADGNGFETDREIECAALVFVWQSWYAWAWCRLRGDFRIFKVSRILEAERTEAERVGPVADLSARPWAREWESRPFERIVLTADRVARTRLGEFFDSEGISETSEGRITVSAFFPIDEWVTSFIMGLPGTVDILEPDSLRVAVRDRAEALIRRNG